MVSKQSKRCLLYCVMCSSKNWFFTWRYTFLLTCRHHFWLRHACRAHQQSATKTAVNYANVFRGGNYRIGPTWMWRQFLPWVPACFSVDPCGHLISEGVNGKAGQWCVTSQGNREPQAWLSCLFSARTQVSTVVGTSWKVSGSSG